MPNKPLTVAWISDFPIEWLPDLPEPLRHLPRRHPATWEMVLLSEFEKNPALRVHVILLRHRMETDVSFERNGVSFHVLKAKPMWRAGTLFWLDTMLSRRLCKKIQPDLIHAWGVERGATVIAPRLGIPYVATVQGLLGWYKERVPLPFYDRFLERLERRVLPRAPVVTAESSFAVKFLRQRWPHLRVQQAEHAPDRVFTQVARNPQTKPMHFISIGTLGFRKGTDVLFKALEQLVSEMDFKITIISNPNPDYIGALQSTTSPNVWERIEFKHHILPHEVAKKLATPVMLLLPTRADTSPNAVKEAVVAGVPVVASQVGGIPDYVFPGQNGFLSAPDEPGAFARAIRSACAHPLLGKGLVEPNALARMRDYLSPERMAKNFLSAYQTTLELDRNRMQSKHAGSEPAL